MKHKPLGERSQSKVYALILVVIFIISLIYYYSSICFPVLSSLSVTSFVQSQTNFSRYDQYFF